MTMFFVGFFACCLLVAFLALAAWKLAPLWEGAGRQPNYPLE
jgi:hypothetical protein